MSIATYNNGSWICGKCGASLGPMMHWCPCSPPTHVVPATNTNSVRVPGCPECGTTFPGKCSKGNCPNFGAVC